MHRKYAIVTAGASALAVFSLAAAQDGAAPAVGAREVFPHVRVDLGARAVEFDGEVPISLADTKAPRVYLELIACIRDTKEHESLVMTQARPSHVHAALLSIGLEPGRPARWTQQDGKVITHAPSGAPVKVEFLTKDATGAMVVSTPSQWIANARTGEAWPGGGEIGKGHWVFAGSITEARDGRDDYYADEAGTLIGLTSFGTEVIAWSGVLSPDSTVDEPEWIADAKHVPAMGTKVTVRISAVDAPTVPNAKP